MNRDITPELWKLVKNSTFLWAAKTEKILGFNPAIEASIDIHWKSYIRVQLGYYERNFFGDFLPGMPQWRGRSSENVHETRSSTKPKKPLLNFTFHKVNHGIVMSYNSTSIYATS